MIRVKPSRYVVLAWRFNALRLPEQQNVSQNVGMTMGDVGALMDLLAGKGGSFRDDLFDDLEAELEAVRDEPTQGT